MVPKFGDTIVGDSTEHFLMLKETNYSIYYINVFGLMLMFILNHSYTIVQFFFVFVHIKQWIITGALKYRYTSRLEYSYKSENISFLDDYQNSSYLLIVRIVRIY